MRFAWYLLFLVACNANENRQVREIGVANNTHYTKENNKDSILYTSQIDSIKQVAKVGDIIFRGGTDIESSVIRNFSYKDKLFSHCGIVLPTDSGVRVVHILGGSTNPAGSILYQSFEDFFAYPDNESAGIYHINLSKAEIKLISEFMDSVQKSGVRFDIKFNLFTKDKLYCTELLIDAISFAKNNNKIFAPTVFNLNNTKYRFLSNRGENFLFYPIDEFQHNKTLTKKAIFYFPNYVKN